MLPFSYEDETIVESMMRDSIASIVGVMMMLLIVLMANKVLTMLLMIHYGQLNKVALKDVEVLDYVDDYANFIASQISWTLVSEFEDCGHEVKCTRMVDHLSTFGFEGNKCPVNVGQTQPLQRDFQIL